MYSNDLIYGISKVQRIVNVQTDGEDLNLFIENEDGTVITQTIPATYWVLTNKRISGKQDELDGSQYYKYLARFDNPNDLKNLQDKLYQKRIDFYRIYDQNECNLVFNGITYFKGMKPKDVSILSFDIETTGLTHDENSKVLLISNTFRRNGATVKRLFAYDDYASQADMLNDWCSFVRDLNPAIIAGHNIFGYDLPYIKFCADRAKSVLALGRDGSELKFNPKSSKKRNSGNDIEYFNATVYGRDFVDTMFLAITYDFAKKYTSYGLKSIIKEEHLEKQDRVFYDAGQIRYNYQDPVEWAKIKAYAIDDADDALALFDLMIPAYFYFTQSVSKTFQQMINSATGSQINNMMVRSYLQIGHSIAKAEEVEKFRGAISFGVAGLYKHALKVDVSSLYPSIIRQYEVQHKSKDPLGHFLQLVETFTIERFRNKALAEETGDSKYKDLQESQKIFINSAYGLLGTNGLNYNYSDGAARVTRLGREVLEKAVVFATGNNVQYWKDKAGIKDEVENESQY
jgi:DNA polymerase elongation subunit (family B)